MTIENLSKDLVEEVLCRVPATYLKRLRSTCVGWNRLIKDDKRFQRKHFDKAAKQYRHLVLCNDFKVWSLSVNLHGEVKLEKLSLVDPHSKNELEIFVFCQCDGLLLCTSQDLSTTVAWNPLIGETKWIRTGKLFGICRVFFLGYCKDNNSGNKSYKFLSKDPVHNECSFIYDFDSDSWRIIDDVSPGWVFKYNGRSISLKGNVYWIAKQKSDKGISLLRFDFSTEKSQPLPLPYQRSSFENLCLSVVRDEKLCVLVQLENTSKTEIWVTNTKAVSWTKLLALDLGPDLQVSYNGSFFLDEENKVVFFSDRWIHDSDETMSKDMVYIVGEDNKVTSVEFGGDAYGGTWPAILNYSPSLVQINPAGGKRKREYSVGDSFKQEAFEPLKQPSLFARNFLD